jgi:signal peptidase I
MTTPATPGLRRRVALLSLAQGFLQAFRLALALALLGAIGIVLVGVAPTAFGFETFSVYSGSMEPAIKVGSLAVIKGMPSTQFRPGDVITYRTPNQPDVVITHRIVSIVQTEDGRRQYRTKGDANQTEDIVFIDPGAVLGKVQYSVPYAGYVVEFSKGVTGRLLLLVLPAVLLLIDFLRGRVTQRSREARADLAVVEPQEARAASADQIELLLSRGRQALEAGHLQLAQRAAEGIIAVDPRNEDAWILKSRALSSFAEQEQLLRAALVLDPSAARIREELDALTMALGSAADAPHTGVAASRSSPADDPDKGADVRQR